MSVTDELCRSYLDLRWHLDPVAGSGAGSVAHDDRLGTFDAESVRQHVAALKALAGAAEDLDVEDVHDEIDRTALLDELRIAASRLEHEQPHVRNPAFWLGHLLEGVEVLLLRPGSTPGAAAPALLARLRAVPAFLEAARGTVHRPPPVFVESAAALADAGESLLRLALAECAGAAPALAHDLATATEQAIVEVLKFGEHLRHDIAPAEDAQAFAVGEAQFNRRLHHEHALRAGAPELWRYGRHLRAEVEAEVAAAARVLDPRRPWREVVERVREEAMPGTDVLGAYRHVTDRAQAFLAARELVTVPPGELRVIETPESLRPLVPFAAYQSPPLLQEDAVGTFFVTTPDPGLPDEEQARLARAHALPSIAGTVAHEAWPGHHLQFLAARSTRSLVRRALWSPLTVEGWALYAEELMDEEGFYDEPAARLFRLVDLLWRAVRVDLDVALHTRGMTPAEAMDELERAVPMERRHVEAEVRRYCAWPTYQLCYAVGRRDLLRLRADVRRQRGDAFSLRGFHDELLRFGGLPVALIRWGMGLES